jgi:hypothetical protein
MTRFETPGQIVLLLAGAAVISVILIALLNVEAKNRKIKGRDLQYRRTVLNYRQTHRLILPASLPANSGRVGYCETNLSATIQILNIYNHNSITFDAIKSLQLKHS